MATPVEYGPCQWCHATDTARHIGRYDQPSCDDADACSARQNAQVAAEVAARTDDEGEYVPCAEAWHYSHAAGACQH